MIQKILNDHDGKQLLEAVFDADTLPETILKTNGVITDYFAEKKSLVYLGKKEEYKLKDLKSFVTKLVTSLSRSYQVNLDSFVTEKVKFEEVLGLFVEKYNFEKFELWNAKTKKDDKKFELSLFSSVDEKTYSKALLKSLTLINSMNFARNLQATPPNVCNSEFLAETVKKEAEKYENLSVKVLNKKEIQDLKMGLLLSVNRGSMYEPRVVVIEYTGDKESKEKTVLVGKGITFDSGGYTLKPGRSMLGMKYDMSGSVIVASSLMAIAQLKPKANFSAILCITDNRINGDASLPDSVWTSMNGKSVEINNTDAEGRLVLADGLTYAIRKLKATRLVTVATLTGAILVALGSTYTGAWATSEKAWEDLSEAAKKQDELVWRMPLDEVFAKEIKNSTVADLKNTDLTGAGAGSCSAAMFLKEFTENVEFIHIDIAGTAHVGTKLTGVMVKTLTQLALKK